MYGTYLMGFQTLHICVLKELAAVSITQQLLIQQVYSLSHCRCTTHAIKCRLLGLLLLSEK